MLAGWVDGQTGRRVTVRCRMVHEVRDGDIVVEKGRGEIQFPKVGTASGTGWRRVRLNDACTMHSQKVRERGGMRMAPARMPRVCCVSLALGTEKKARQALTSAFPEKREGGLVRQRYRGTAARGKSFAQFQVASTCCSCSPGTMGF